MEAKNLMYNLLLKEKQVYLRTKLMAEIISIQSRGHYPSVEFRLLFDKDVNIASKRSHLNTKFISQNSVIPYKLSENRGLTFYNY